MKKLMRGLIAIGVGLLFMIFWLVAIVNTHGMNIYAISYNYGRYLLIARWPELVFMIAGYGAGAFFLVKDLPGFIAECKAKSAERKAQKAAQKAAQAEQAASQATQEAQQAADQAAQAAATAAAYSQPVQPVETAQPVQPVETVQQTQPVQETPSQDVPRFCPECGKEFAMGSKFCAGCGHKLS